MPRTLTALATVGLLFGCATAPPPAHEPAEAALTASALLASPPPAAIPALPLLAEEDSRHEGTTYLTGKGGLFYPDESDIDPGYILNLAYGRYFTRLVSIELEGGYLVPDPDVPDSDLFAVPLMVNGRLNLPLWILEVYGGVGVGGMYYDLDVGPIDEDGWLLAGNVHLGADIALFDTLTGGLELKYYVTEESDDTFDETLSGLAAMLTLGFRF